MKTKKAHFLMTRRTLPLTKHDEKTLAPFAYQFDVVHKLISIEKSCR